MKFAIIAVTRKYPVAEVLARVTSWIFAKGHQAYGLETLQTYLPEESRQNLICTATESDAVKASDVVISIGGDGTLLYAARLVMSDHKPILGINSGRLGFLANVAQGRIEEALGYTSKGNFQVDKRFMLEADTPDGNTHYALNEFLFSKGPSGTMISLTAYYDGKLINRYWSDGIIVATPTGSTAYNMSSGGPIIMPTSEVVVLNPINPHTLTTRPLILPADKTILIRSEPAGQDVIFSKDGEICDISGVNMMARICRSDFTIDLIKLPEQTYFDTLRNKLMWGMDIRDNVDF
jgi:NAD+ kinase